MIIERIDKKRLLIVLENYDMTSLGISYNDISWEDKNSRIIMARLLTLAKIETGFSIENCKLSIQALPQYNGCAIIFTISPYPKHKSNKNNNKSHFKSEYKTSIYKFDKIEHLFSLCKKIKNHISEIKDSIILKIKNFYYLVLYYNSKLPMYTDTLLSEYACPLKSNKITISHLCEQGTLIGKNNALNFIVNNIY